MQGALTTDFNLMPRKGVSNMAHFRFILRMSLDAIGITRTLFWVPVCVAWLSLKRCLAFIGLERAKKGVSECADCLPDVAKKGKRVLFTPSDNNAGSGAFRCMVELTSLLRSRHGVEPLIVLPYEGTGTQLLEEEGLPHVTIRSNGWTIPIGTGMRNWRNAKRMVLDMLRNFRSVSKLRELIRQYNVDVVHVNTTWTYVGALAAKAEGVPCVWHLREHLEEGLNRTMWSRSMGNRLIASSAKVVAISKCIANKYRGIIPESTLMTICDGVDEARFHRSGREIMHTMPYTFVFLGNFNRHKGQVEFSMACAKLHEEGVRDFRIWFVGGGDPDVRVECEAIFTKACMQDLVTYYGFQKNPENYLEKADVAFTCSQYEGWGRVTAEAMMAGCLAVGSDTGATPELIENGVSGLLFHYEPGRCDSLAETIRTVLSDSRRCQKMAEIGRRRAISEMTSTLNADKVFSIYTAICKCDNSTQG